MMRLSRTWILLHMYGTLVLLVGELHMHASCENCIVSRMHLVFVPTSCPGSSLSFK